MHDQIFSSVKTAGIAAAGLTGIYLPEWIQSLNEILGNLQGIYALVIVVLTAAVLMAQRRFYNRGNRN